MESLRTIGYIRSKFKAAKPADARLMKKEISYIDVKEEFAEGLFKIEISDFIDIIFRFHLSKGYEIKTHTYSGDYKGVFATRSPKRPSSVGVTSVKLLGRKGNTLKVTGLDAIDGTPVIDIKTSDTYLLQQNLDEISLKRLKSDPRKDILALILANDTEKLLLKAAQIHGHFCPGLAMGILAATYAMNHLKIDDSDGLEDVIAIMETNNCMSDGVQFVTGCTFGNNALVFHDIGKMAFTLARRTGKGVRISARADSKEYMRSSLETFSEQYSKVVKEKDHSKKSTSKFKQTGLEAALNTLKLDFDKIFEVEQTKVNLPEYAPSHDSILCEKCGEGVMATRIEKKDDKNLCIPCAEEIYYQLSGNGIDKSRI